MPDGTVTMEIGDTQGHDVDAAAAMGQVRASIRAIAAAETDPATVLTRINQLLVSMGAARFARRAGHRRQRRPCAGAVRAR
ncbi:SpoIIE family protein phosphatase [Streptomyces olivochromogenes]|nr:SpoIIE family protein phosphatase [Streptomyces olivochromogenes]MCF3128954.1 SpoIIE family protein phosphatase [Streptomyces olivochromogenes]